MSRADRAPSFFIYEFWHTCTFLKNILSPAAVGKTRAPLNALDSADHLVPVIHPALQQEDPRLNRGGIAKILAPYSCLVGTKVDWPIYFDKVYQDTRRDH